MTLHSKRIAILLAAATLAACGAMERPAEPKTAAAQSGPMVPLTCPGGMYTPPVTINQFVVTGPTTATINVNPPKKVIGTAPGGVLWNFAGNNQSFTALDGITLKPGSAAGPISSGFGNNPSEYVVCFGDTSSSPMWAWNYHIKFYDNATPTRVWICDPTIVNSDSFVGPDARNPVTCNKVP